MTKIATEEEYLGKKQDKIIKADKLLKEIHNLKEEFDNVQTGENLDNLEEKLKNI